MLIKWLPWKFILKHAARTYGFLDPFMFLARFQRLSQPSEVAAPLELVRAGLLFHLRGIINTRTIQNNLDWIWPYWVRRQFNPRDASFIPRANSLSHVNLTQRNWTAVGLPNCPVYPIVDPRGMVTPFHDGWSLDFWIAAPGPKLICPTQGKDPAQNLLFSRGLSIRTVWEHNGARLESETELCREDNRLLLRSALSAARESGWLAVSLRPFNPEGIQFIDTIEKTDGRHGWLVDGEKTVLFDEAPGLYLFSKYDEGDVYHKIGGEAGREKVACQAGMATAAALFPLNGGETRRVTVTADVTEQKTKPAARRALPPRGLSWAEAAAKAAPLSVPDEKIQFLYDAAVRSLILFSPDDIYPGPYTYRRFWFRDACHIIHALLALGLNGRAEKALNRFPGRQKRNGYFESQEGEWDSNGQVLWAADRFQKTTRSPLDPKLVKALEKGARWIGKKRLPGDASKAAGGLFPAGFSAEHLGPNDYYYWDNFWGCAGLRAAADLFTRLGMEPAAESARKLADDFHHTIWQSIGSIPPGRSAGGGIPASPLRRMDSGAVGSLVADYPLQLTPPGHPRIMATADYLLENCFVEDGFFQDMTHSGINAYLTLHIAQTLLRAGDPRWLDLVKTVARLASPTGQWPEAIHPRLKSGCMGDGQHAWASAEWVMMLRNCFLREEGDVLIAASGIFPEWLESGEEISFGPAPTAFGTATVTVTPKGGGKAETKVAGRWKTKPKAIRAATAPPAALRP